MTTTECAPSVDWSSYAQVYDLMADRNPAYTDLHREIMCRVEELQLAGPRVIADLGAGTGQYSLALATSLPDARVVHVEPDAAMISRARERMSARTQSNIEYRNEPASRDLFAPRSLDLCTCVHALYTMPDPIEALGWIHSWLKPGAVLVLCDLGRVLDVRDWRRFILGHMLRESGVLGTIKTLWAGRQVVRQNKLIAERQRTGQYWTNSSEGIQSIVADVGFSIESASPCYRGYSDLIVARKVSVEGIDVGIRPSVGLCRYTESSSGPGVRAFLLR